MPVSAFLLNRSSDLGRDVELPKCTIIMERMGRYSHYLVGYDGKYYDPNLGVIKEFDMAKMVGYLEIIVE